MLSDLFGWHFLFEKTLREIKKEKVLMNFLLFCSGNES